ncbi:hypothetical protein QTP86_008912 [Hemibagrus guttatus]|nr:hypothetical protein QTP86_008912 [Hemibagrus guttatus]
MRLFALVFLTFCSTRTCTEDVNKCPDGCECTDWKGLYVSCTDIATLPLFPGNTETLRLYETRLNSVPPDAFANMENISLIYLSVDVTLRSLEKNSFFNLKKITHIEITDNIYITEIPGNAFQGITNDVLTVYLHRNKQLTDLSEDMFAETISGPVLLDISESAVTSLPARGLESLRELSARNVWALKKLPPIKTFRHLIGADMTYPSHCCAFKNLKKKKGLGMTPSCSNMTAHKARSIKTWMSEFGVEELDWPAQSPDLNPIEHLWDELEQRLRARPSSA